jgi:hypothetical protein
MRFLAMVEDRAPRNAEDFSVKTLLSLADASETAAIV